MSQVSVFTWKTLCNWTISFRALYPAHPDSAWMLLYCHSCFTDDPQLGATYKWQYLSLVGIPTYVLLNTSGISSPARVDRLELLSISGGSLKSITVKHYPDRKPYGIWNISDFVPPDEAFFLKVTGYDKDGYLFQRVSSVSFSSIVPGKAMFHSALECW